MNVWGQFVDVLGYLGPVLTITVLIAILVYLFFARAVPALSKRLFPGSSIDGLGGDAAERATWPVYVAMASTLGSVLGVLLSVLGGFGRTENGGENTMIGALVSTLVVVLAAASSIFDSGAQLQVRRPMAALSFLLCFLLCGLYWKFIRAAIS
ncbi:MAG: hypothetical protein ABL866_06420 [Devosia sp.]